MIAGYLGLKPEMHCDLEALFKISQLGQLFSSDEILEYYIIHGNTMFCVHGRTFSCGEVIFSSPSILHALDDIACSVLQMDEFITRNSLKIPVSFVNLFEFTDRTKTTLENRLKEFYEFIDRSDAEYERIACSGILREKTKRIVEDGLLHYKMCNFTSAELKITAATFKLHVEEHSVSAIMTYEMTREEMESLSIALRENSAFRAACLKHLKEQGCHNTTMFVISKLCSISLPARNVDLDRADELLCVEHSQGIARALEDFAGIPEILPIQAYYLYLHEKEDLRDDISEITSILQKSRPILPKEEADSLLGIIDICMRENMKIPISKSIIYLLPYLEDQPYFPKILGEYAATFIACNIKLVKYSEELEKVNAVVNFLKQFAEHSTPYELNSDIPSDFMMSQPINSGRLPEENNDGTFDNISNVGQVPLLEFNTHNWLSEKERTLVLDEYIKHYSVSQLSNNFLAVDKPSKKALEYFLGHYGEITDNAVRGIVMCKLSVDIPIGMFKTSDVMAICYRAASIYPLRMLILAGDIPKKYILKLLNGLEEKADSFMAEVNNAREWVSEDFAIQFLHFLSEKYEFSFIFEYFEYFIGRFPIPVANLTQKYLIRLMQDMFFVDEYFAMIEKLYKRMIEIKQSKIQKGNEHVLALLLQSAKLMGREAYVGNLRESSSNLK